MVQTPDGTLVMFVMKARRVGSPESHVHPIRSTDGGLTWGPMGPEMSLFGGSTEPHAMDRALITSGGDWMLPVYGADEPGGATYAAVAFSPDMGRTWGGKVVVARSSGHHLLRGCRDQDARTAASWPSSAHRTRPSTATSPTLPTRAALGPSRARSPSRGRPPSSSLLRSGAIACFYRDRDPQRPGVSVSVTADGGENWTYAGQVYRGKDWNCGYPSAVRLPDGRLFCVYYSCYEGFNSEVHGVYITEDV